MTEIENRIFSNRKMLEFFNHLINNNNNIIDNNDIKSSLFSSCIIDLYSFMNILKLIYKSLDKKGKKELDETIFEIIVNIPPIAMNYRCGIFIKEGYQYKDTYLKKLEKIAILDFIPRTKEDIDRINKAICEIFKNWTLPGVKFFDDEEKELNNNDDYVVMIKDQSYFNEEWLYHKFDNYNNNNDDFHIGYGLTISIPIIHLFDPSSDTMDIYQYKQLNSTFISLPYKNIKYSMLIIMPDKPHTKQELIQFCNDKLKIDNIDEFYKKKTKVQYNFVNFPKNFEFKSNWQFKHDIIESSLSSASNQNGPTINLSNISNDLSNDISFQLVNLKSGFNIKCDAVNIDDVNYNARFLAERPNILKINKCFVFMIIDNDYSIINKIGIFTGICNVNNMKMMMMK